MKLLDCTEFNVLRRHQDNLFRFMTITAGADDLVVRVTLRTGAPNLGPFSKYAFGSRS